MALVIMLKRRLGTMSVYKNNGKWDCQFYYVDFTGERKKKHKRGFDSKKEALEYERESLNHLEGSMDMTFASFAEVYRSNVSPRFKEKSMTNKMGAVNKHIIPYFGNKKMNEIKPADIIDWQNSYMCNSR